MLNPQEALLVQAIKDEEQRQLALQAGSLLGATAGVVSGMSPSVPYGTKLNPRRKFTGGLTGLILGGGAGAGLATMMKKDSEAAQLLAKIQGQGGQLSEMDESLLVELLGQIYQNPSQMA